ncbi:MAG: hypothetical protein N3D74_06250 [Caldisericia bacterium]|nr:hypothetical protein [Caldisericia bacterium]
MIESNNIKWKIYIDGDKNYIEDLIFVLKNLNFNEIIYKEGEEYLLDSKIFKEIDDAKKLSEKVKTFLTFLSNTFIFKKFKEFHLIKSKINLSEVKEFIIQLISNYIKYKVKRFNEN